MSLKATTRQKHVRHDPCSQVAQSSKAKRQENKQLNVKKRKAQCNQNKHRVL